MEKPLKTMPLPEVRPEVADLRAHLYISVSKTIDGIEYLLSINLAQYSVTTIYPDIS